MSTFYHTTQDGQRIPLGHLEMGHLCAIVRLIEQKVADGVILRSGGTSICDDEPWYDETELSCGEALAHFNYAEYVAELERRAKPSFAKYNRIIDVDGNSVYVYNSLHTNPEPSFPF